MTLSMWTATIAFAVIFQVIQSSSGCSLECPEGTFIQDVLCCCVPCEKGTYNDKPNQYYCEPCETAYTSGFKTCPPPVPWDSDCNPTSSRWCTAANNCKSTCKRGTYYDVVEGKCVQCPYGTYQYYNGRGCCIVRECPKGTVPGPSRFNGAFPPLCIPEPTTTPPPPKAPMCYPNCTCKKPQVIRAPLTDESISTFDSALGDDLYGKKNYTPCTQVKYELPCKEGAVVVVRELELGAGDMLQIDGVNITGPTNVKLPRAFFLPPEDMNFTFTTDCCDERPGFSVMYFCMNKVGRDFIEETGVADDCMVRSCMKNETFAKYLLRIGSGEHQLLQEPITCPVSLLIGQIRLPKKDCSSCTPKCLDMGNHPVQECPSVYNRFVATSNGQYCV